MQGDLIVLNYTQGRRSRWHFSFADEYPESQVDQMSQSLSVQTQAGWVQIQSQPLTAKRMRSQLHRALKSHSCGQGQVSSFVMFCMSPFPSSPYFPLFLNFPSPLPFPLISPPLFPCFFTGRSGYAQAGLWLYPDSLSSDSLCTILIGCICYICRNKLPQIG